MSLVDELNEYSKEDEKIVGSFKSKERLCDDIFKKKDGEYVMHKQVRSKLLEIADDFMDHLGIEFFIHDVTLTGSLSNFNWSEYSDVDLHILIDFDELNYSVELIKEFFDAKKNIWNKNRKVKIKEFDVEIYVQDVDEPHVSSGVYSILNNKWLIEPQRKSHNIDDKKILQKSDEFVRKIDKLVKSKDSPEEILKTIDRLRERLKSFRKAGLDSGGEYSYENLTFKLLRRGGYIQKLMDLKDTLTNKKLSIER
jgi:hypothetical protein